MLPVRRALPICWLAAGVSGLLADSAYAEISEAACEQVRSVSQKETSRWLGLSKAGALTAIKDAGSYNKRVLNKIIYLHGRDDESRGPTVMAVKITFHTQGNYTDQNWLRAQNNFKNSSVKTKLQDYQDFHNGSKEIYDLKTNFHLEKGPFNWKIPFTTFRPDDRRRQLTLAQNSTSDERTYRAYLFTFRGIAATGSCIDFDPYFPIGTKQTQLEIVDLLPETGSEGYYRASIKFGLTE